MSNHLVQELGLDGQSLRCWSAGDALRIQGDLSCWALQIAETSLIKRNCDAAMRSGSPSARCCHDEQVWSSMRVASGTCSGGPPRVCITRFGAMPAAEAAAWRAALDRRRLSPVMRPQEVVIAAAELEPLSRCARALHQVGRASELP